MLVNFTERAAAKIVDCVHDWEQDRRSPRGRRAIYPVPQRTAPATYVLGTLGIALTRTDGSVGVNVPGGHEIGTDPQTAWNHFGDSGPSGANVLLLPNTSYQISRDQTPQDTAQWIIVRVPGQNVQVTADVGYDYASGTFRKTFQNIYCAGFDPPQSPFGFTQVAEPALGMIRAATSTSVAADNTTVHYGQTIHLTATVAFTTQNGSAVPNGYVAWSVDGQWCATTQVVASGSAYAATLDSSNLPAAALPVGSRVVSAQYFGDQYYQGSQGSLTVTVQKADATAAISLLITPRTYGDANSLTVTVTPESGCACTPTGNVTIDDTLSGSGGGTTQNVATGSLVASGPGRAATAYVTLPKLAAGSHGLVARFLPDGPPNWNTSQSDSASLTVTKRVATLTPDAATRGYGYPDPFFTWTWSGVAFGDLSGSTPFPGVFTGSPTVTSNADATSPVGSAYVVTAVQGSLAADNYTFAFQPGTLAVVPAPLTLAADNQVKAVAAPVPTLTASLSGLKNGDDIGYTCQTSATVSSQGGTYPITCSIVDASPSKLANYTLTIRNATLLVE